MPFDLREGGCITRVKSLIATLLTMALCLSGVAFAVEQTPAACAVGDRIEDFTLTTCDGVSYTLSEALEDKELVLIALWETPDSMSEQELTFLREAHAEYRERAEVFALCQTAEADEALRALSENLALTFPLGQGGTWLAAEALPVFLAVDQTQTVRLIQTGALTSAESCRALFERALDGPPEGMSDYTLIYLDQNGDPVEDLIANICDDSLCAPMFTDAGGAISFQFPSFAYHVQVIRVPEGYGYDMSQESYLDEDGGTYTFVVTRNQ